jgi:YbbR domain-containing protein
MKSYIDKFAVFSKRTNLVPKLLSIILAVILWAYITNTRSGDLRFNIPVDLRNIDNSLVVSKVSQKTATVRVSGPKDDLKNVSARDIIVYVDMNRAKEGEYADYKIEFNRNEVPEGIDIKIIPDEIKVLAERKISREVKIVPRFSGNAEKGFYPGEAEVFPETVILRGAASLLNEIDSLYTENISLEGISETVERKVNIEKPDMENVEYSSETVTVTLPVISSSDLEKTGIPLSVRNGKKGFTYTIDAEKVYVHIIPEKGKKISDYNFSAYVDAAMFKGDYSVLDKDDKIEWTADVDINSKIPESRDRVVSITPDKVVVIIEKD